MIDFFRIRASAIAVFAVVVLAGCRGEAEQEPASTPETRPASTLPDASASPAAGTADSSTATAEWNEVTSSDGTYVVAYKLEPSRVPLNEPFGLRARVYDADERSEPLEDVNLAVDGRMPHHRHGMNRVPTLDRTDDGGFIVRNMLFHMPGYWELHFDITRGMTTERAQVEITLE